MRHRSILRDEVAARLKELGNVSLSSLSFYCSALSAFQLKYMDVVFLVQLVDRFRLFLSLLHLSALCFPLESYYFLQLVSCRLGTREANFKLALCVQVSDSKHVLERTFLSPAAVAAGRLLITWMKDAGLRTYALLNFPRLFSWPSAVGMIHLLQ